jgi:hypothetical protein
VLAAAVRPDPCEQLADTKGDVRVGESHGVVGPKDLGAPLPVDCAEVVDDAEVGRVDDQVVAEGLDRLVGDPLLAAVAIAGGGDPAPDRSSCGLKGSRKPNRHPVVSPRAARHREELARHHSWRIVLSRSHVRYSTSETSGVAASLTKQA